MSIIIKRIIILPFMLLIISFFTFFLTSIIPGDIAENIIAKNGGQPTLESILDKQEELGLSEPLLGQYFEWLMSALQFDLGISWITKEPVVQSLLTKVWPTIILTGSAMIIGIAVSVILGTLAAYYKDTIIDKVILTFSLLLSCIPDFLLAFVLLYLFAYTWQLVPLFGYGTIGHLILPACILGMGLGAGKARILRASLLEVQNSQYIVMARSKGLSSKRVLFKHALRNALIPFTTSLGASIAFLIGGTVIIESIFNWPGLGKLALQAISNRDIPLMQGYVLLMAVITIVINLIVDLVYMLLDPRVKVNGVKMLD
ncbi:ABC transporter permease [Lysinibacillus sp. NPDC097231]|uniref:ABC transporter permease n=1 Tax=Lysinibacillus sp. NPDC097231 TaxID=3364142 RepID=UPI00383042A2